MLELKMQPFMDALDILVQWSVVCHSAINKVIRGLDHKQQRTKTLAEISSHLYAVKVAWRNEVMHPKQTYTSEEADAVFRNVRIFIRELTEVI